VAFVHTNHKHFVHGRDIRRKRSAADKAVFVARVTDRSDPNRAVSLHRSVCVWSADPRHARAHMPPGGRMGGCATLISQHLGLSAPFQIPPAATRTTTTGRMQNCTRKSQSSKQPGRQQLPHTHRMQSSSGRWDTARRAV